MEIRARVAAVAPSRYTLGHPMKITIDIDCTPEEARTFFGLPDLKPMQEAVLREVQERVLQNLRLVDAESLVKTWMPIGLQGFEQLQKMMWAQLGQSPRTEEK